MKCSQNELASLIKKAAMGCGYPEGLAKEISAAALLLSSHNAEVALACLTNQGAWCVALHGPAFFDQAYMALSMGDTQCVSDILHDVDCVEMLEALALAAQQNYGLITEIDSRETETRLSVTLDAPTPQPQRLGAMDVPETIYKALDALAQKTYVPATAASRLKGAGAGLTDND